MRSGGILSQKKYFGGGTYKMTDVKKMTAKDDFLKMPRHVRNCEAYESYEDCKTRLWRSLDIKKLNH